MKKSENFINHQSVKTLKEKPDLSTVPQSWNFINVRRGV
ncbi:hypothetical protein THERMOT_2274 [Bathymodiolus thermophilus thioautotrophic gill symbiont]|nr:hypothetical protein THERMOT_2274 [Bathymodiolus thermophilus thioautotrophic gill symbiont]